MVDGAHTPVSSTAALTAIGESPQSLEQISQDIKVEIQALLAEEVSTKQRTYAINAAMPDIGPRSAGALDFSEDEELRTLLKSGAIEVSPSPTETRVNPLSVHKALPVLERKELTPSIQQQLLFGGLKYFGKRWQEAEMMASQADVCDEKIARVLREAINGSRTPTTLKIYRSKAIRFLRWWRDLSISLPLHRARNLFLAHLTASGDEKQVSTSIAALNFFFDPQAGHHKEVEKAISDMAARRERPVVHRNKISLNDYLTIIRVVASSDTLDRAGALCIVLFRGLLRISEALHLRVSDICQLPEAEVPTWEIRIRRSKTDQSGKGQIVNFSLKFMSQEYVILSSFLDGSCDRTYVFQSQSTDVLLPPPRVEKSYLSSLTWPA